jgi:arginyl-tRNA synthetase
MPPNPTEALFDRYITLRDKINGIVGDAFHAHGFPREVGEVISSNRPDLCQFQCNAALILARRINVDPMGIAAPIAAELEKNNFLRNVKVAKPGFINLDVDDEALAANVSTLPLERWSEAVPPVHPLKVIIDYGGANVAKPMHVGHLRSAILGETIKRVGRFLGHSVIGDIHLGDWGLQMGMLIEELRRERPDLPYFHPTNESKLPEEFPLTIGDLDRLYPSASSRAKADPEFAAAARQATLELQKAQPGYIALWRHIVRVSVADLKLDYGNLGVEFDLWLGESDAEAHIPYVLDAAQTSGLAYISEGALVTDVNGDDEPALPPIILKKSDGGFLYSTTDLATLVQREHDYRPDLILYVVDNRQSTHLSQVFRAAKKIGLIHNEMMLEHVNFGTMNGKDGKPFKTRAGGTMKLKDLIAMVTEKALDRLNESDIVENCDVREKHDIAHKVGIASLKFGDLSNIRTKDYVFDLDRFSSFEGRTGPYLLYLAVRAKSILRKVGKLPLGPELMPANSVAERELYLHLSGFGDALERTWKKRAPSELCEYSYELANRFSVFYRDHHVLSEPDIQRRDSYIQLTSIFLRVLLTTLNLLGIEVPDRM